MKTINQRIKAYRQSLGISQTEAAASWGIKQSTLSKIENGKREVGPTAAYLIERATRGKLKNLWAPKERRGNGGSAQPS